MKRSPLLLMMVTLMAGLFIFSPASAQSDVGLYLSPEQDSVLTGSIVTLDLMVVDGLDVNAFDVVLNYDQDRLLLTDWQHGGYLQGLFCVHEVEEIGHLELGCTQVSQPAVSGSGTLLKLTFETLAVGDAAVEITSAELADPLGVKSTPWLGDSLIIIENPTPIPTTTFTPTITATRTTRPTSTKKPKPTSGVTAVVPTAAPSLSLPTSTLTAFPSPSPTWTQTEQLARTIEPSSGDTSSTTTLTPVTTVTPMPSFDQDADMALLVESSAEENDQNESDFSLLQYWWAILIAVILAAGLGSYAAIRHHNKGKRGKIL